MDRSSTPSREDSRKSNSRRETAALRDAASCDVADPGKISCGSARRRFQAAVTQRAGIASAADYDAVDERLPGGAFNDAQRLRSRNAAGGSSLSVTPDARRFASRNSRGIGKIAEGSTGTAAGGITQEESPFDGLAQSRSNPDCTDGKERRKAGIDQFV